MRNPIVGATVLLLTLLAAPAHAVPAWCNTPGGEKANPNSYTIRDLAKEDPRDAVTAVVQILCYPNSDVSSAQGDAQAALKKWSTVMHMDEADWTDAVVWVAKGSRNNETIYPDAQGQDVGIGGSIKRAWSSMSAIDQYASALHGIGFSSGHPSQDPHYLIDAYGPKLTEVGRFGYIQRCLGSNAKQVEWAMCQPDIELFNGKKFGEELRADKRGPYERMAIRVELALAQEKLAERAQKVKAAIAADPAYAKMFEFAKQARKEWDARWAKGGELLALNMEMDDARQKDSRKAFDGCDEKTWNAFKAAVGAIPAKSFERKGDDIGNPWLEQIAATINNNTDGYLAANAYYICATRDRDKKPDGLLDGLGGAMQRWPGFRGPRNATHTMILTAGLELDDRSAKIEYPDCSRPFQGYATGGVAATVAAIKPTGKGSVRVEWVKKMEPQQQCSDLRKTNRVTMIRNDGVLVYQTVCHKYTTVIVNTAPAPQDADAKYAAPVKPGLNAQVAHNVIIGAWPKGKTIPVAVVGVPVK